eukprot:TRINITY_DN57291_c0_g1_i1.p1 TRINITY_DN57291_c0_g1~~TRINITY_DN57291_c0_g1_i1.p1  ORF type:complete len:177 (+),score=30.55 TRINITY_DN57291_c0_g1_i1:166-696(+)
MSRAPFPEVSHLHSVKVDNVSCTQDSVVGTKEELREKFSKYGEVGDIYIPRDRNFAFVRFYEKRDAEDAIDGMDGREIQNVQVQCSMSMQAKKMPQEYRDSERNGGRGGRSRSWDGGRHAASDVRGRGRDDSRRGRRGESRSRRRRRDDSRRGGGGRGRRRDERGDSRVREGRRRG